MRQTCQVCKQQVYIDDETQHKFDNYPDYPHRCQIKPNPIRLYDNIGGIQFDRREESIARDITDETIRCKLDPYKVRVVRQGDFLILK